MTGGVAGGGATHALEIGPWQVELPEAFTEFRPHQERAIREVVEYFQAGYRWVFLDAPTGAGKTIIGEAVRQIMSRRPGSTDPSLYLCTTKTLQEQFVHDFPYARLIKGRANYPTKDRPDLFFTERLSERRSCDDCVKTVEWKSTGPFCSDCPPWGWEVEDEDKRVVHCASCHPVYECPYYLAKEAAKVGPLTVANTAYLMAEANYIGEFSNRYPLWVIDEADTLEGLLMSHTEVGLSRRMLRQLRFEIPDKVTVPGSWVEWIDTHKPIVQQRAATLVGNPDRQREYKRLTTLANQMGFVRKALAGDEKTMAEPENWVLDGYKQGGMYIKPVTVAGHADHFLWRHGESFLLMSATMVSDAQMAADLGIDEWATVRVDSQFPVERRPIYVQPRVNMSSKTKETEWPKMVDEVRKVIERHRGERILVHTVSYELADYLARGLSDEWAVMTYHNAQEREEALAKFRVTDGAVMLAPSLDRGVDLPDDDVRVIVIAKVPFPYLGDKQVSSRLYGGGALGRTWYATQTVRSLVQMTGRGMRHKDDMCVSYILDSQFTTNVWRSSRHLIPQWWADALQWSL